jgi:hypothetical protein
MPLEGSGCHVSNSASSDTPPRPAARRAWPHTFGEARGETLGEPLLDIGDVVGEVSTAFSGSDESDDGDAPAAGTGLAL